MTLDGPSLFSPEFVAPGTVDEAVEALDGDDAMALSGGTSVGLLIGQGLIQPSKLVWLAKIPELKAVTSDGERMVIGAAVTLRELARDPTVRSTLPALAQAASVVGNPRVRAVATLGGAIAHGDPRQDVPPVLLAHAAVLTVAGREGRRQVPLDGFFTGFMETGLGRGEIVTEIAVPLVAGRRGAYARFTPASAADYPVVAVAATVTRDGEGTITHASVALGGVGATAVLVPEARSLAGGRATASEIQAVAATAAAVSTPVDDRLGSAAYKQAMVAVWTRRTLEACLADPAPG